MYLIQFNLYEWLKAKFSFVFFWSIMIAVMSTRTFPNYKHTNLFQENEIGETNLLFFSLSFDYFVFFFATTFLPLCISIRCNYNWKKRKISHYTWKRQSFSMCFLNPKLHFFSFLYAKKLAWTSFAWVTIQIDPRLLTNSVRQVHNKQIPIFNKTITCRKLPNLHICANIKNETKNAFLTLFLKCNFCELNFIHSR